MKKQLPLLLSLSLFCLLVLPVSAQTTAGQAGGQAKNTTTVETAPVRMQDPTTHQADSVQPIQARDGSGNTGYQVQVINATSPNAGAGSDGQAGQGNTTARQVQNEVSTQNAGQDQQLRVSTNQETQAAEQVSRTERSNQAKAAMSTMAQKVEQVLQNRGEESGIGPQISQFAQDYQTSQTRVAEAIDQADRRSSLRRLLWGADQSAVSALEEESAQLESQIEELRTAAEEANPEDQQVVVGLAADLEIQKETLDAKIAAENTGFSVRGFFRRLFSRN